MAKYVLICYCGNRDFRYDEPTFTCTKCNNSLDESDAGNHLISEED